MNKYSIKLTEDNGDMHFYTDVTSIHIDDGRIEIEYDGVSTDHQLALMDEIIITANR